MKNKKQGIGLIVTIVIIAVIAIIIGTVLLVLNNNKNNETTGTNNNTQTNTTEQENNENNKKDEVEEENEWGITDHFAADNDKPSESFYINFPNYGGTSRGYGLVGNQAEDTAVVVSGQNDYAPQINGISELFPAYFDQLEYTLGKTYGLRASNFELTLIDNAPTKVGDYDMHTFTGTIDFDFDGNNGIQHNKYQFVAYATTLKSNGAYAYWVVYDTSEDQSKGELIKRHALNMAKTFREEQ